MANRTVLIPSETDPFVVKINNDVYSYPAGTEQSVPDKVADLIDNYWELQPKQAKAVDGGMLPYVTEANDGDVLKVKDGAWQAGTDETGGGIIPNPSPAGTTPLKGLQIEDTKYSIFQSLNSGKTGYGFIYGSDTSGFWQPTVRRYTLENSYVGVNKVWNCWADKSEFGEATSGLTYALPVLNFDGSDSSATRGSLVFSHKSGTSAFFYGVLSVGGTLKAASAEVVYNDANNVIVATLTTA